METNELLLYFPAQEICRGIGDASNIVRGVASVYYRGGQGEQCQPYGDGTIERIAEGAWDNCDISSVIATYNHRQHEIVGRTPKTLQLAVTKRGLEYSLRVGNTSYGRDLLTNIEDENIRGCSFIASPDPKSARITSENGQRVVTITRMKKLKEITMCVEPYYSAAVIERGKRWHDEIEKEYQDEIKRQVKSNQILAAIRSRGK